MSLLSSGVEKFDGHLIKNQWIKNGLFFFPILTPTYFLQSEPGIIFNNSETEVAYAHEPEQGTKFRFQP